MFCAHSNWLEGLILMALYVILAVVFWFYPGASPGLCRVMSELTSSSWRRCHRAGPSAHVLKRRMKTVQTRFTLRLSEGSSFLFSASAHDHGLCVKAMCILSIAAVPFLYIVLPYLLPHSLHSRYFVRTCHTFTNILTIPHIYLFAPLVYVPRTPRITRTPPSA